MREIDFEKIMKIVRDAAQLFGNEEAAEHIKAKGKADFVTEVDTSVQAKICGELKALYSEIQFMGEEKDNSDIDFEKPVWILDPVDGTTNLIHRYHASSVSLGLADKGQVIAGMIYNPYLDELFFAEKNKGAFCNGKPVHVSDAPDLASSLVSIGTNPYHREDAGELFAQVKEIFVRCHDIRRIGSAAIDMCYVACGRAEAYFEASLKPWDYAAGKLIVEEAGGRVTTYEGNPLTVDRGQSVLATNGHVHEEIRGFLNIYKE